MGDAEATLPPARDDAAVSRPRLENLLYRILEVPYTALEAPAGYGKTTLMAQWSRASHQNAIRVAWLKVGDHNRQAQALLLELHALLMGSPAMGVSPPDGLAAVRAILASLSGSPAPVVLFLDDICLLDQPAATALASIICGLPRHAHIVTASRQAPPLDLARVQGRGGGLHLTVAELRFTLDEARSYFNQLGPTKLPAGQAELLFEGTEGWPAGLALARADLGRVADPLAYVKGFSGEKRSIHGFFTTHVMHDLPAAVREFLLATCMLDRLSTELCDAVTGTANGRHMLDWLQRNGLFLVPMDDERNWYRYHCLLAGYLHRRLADERPHDAVLGHRRAGRWFLAQGQVMEGIGHVARAQDPDALAELLDEHAEALLVAGHGASLEGWIAGLPGDMLSNRPALLLAAAWLHAEAMRYREASALLLTAELAVEALKQAEAPTARLASLELMIRHRRLVVAGAADDVFQVEWRARDLADDVADGKPYMACTANAMMILCRREQFDFGRLDSRAAAARMGARDGGFQPGLYRLNVVLASAYAAMGLTSVARNLLEDGLADATREGGHPSSPAAFAGLLLAEIAYEANEVDHASALLAAHLPRAHPCGAVDHLIAGHCTQAWMTMERGDTRLALRELDHAIQFAIDSWQERLRVTLATLRIRLLLQAGETEEAQWEGRREELLGPGAEMLPPARARTIDEHRAMAWARLAELRGRSAEALSLAQKWGLFCDQHGAVRSATRWHILAARLQMTAGNTRGAQQALRRALKAGAGSRFVRSFLHEGGPIRTLLEHYGAGPPESSPAGSLAREVLAAFGGAPPNASASEPGLLGRLSGREIEILTLVSTGLRNREIGDRLGLTEGSVKWYMQQVYDKLGSRRRSQAVDRARCFGLIA